MDILGQSRFSVADRQASCQIVKEGADVTIEHVADASEQTLPRCVQRVVRLAAGTKTIREVPKVLLVDLFQQRRYGTLNDFVFQGVT